LSGTNENNGLARDVGHGDGGADLPRTTSTVTSSGERAKELVKYSGCLRVSPSVRCLYAPLR